MKNIIAVILFSMVFAITGCKEDKNNIDLSNTEYSTDTAESQEAVYGPVVSSPGVAVKPLVVRAKLGDGISTLTFVSRKPHPQVVVFICEARGKEWGITHTVKNMDGGEGVRSYDKRQEATGAEFSVYSFRKGQTQIREQDEFNDPVFSTVNGQNSFMEMIESIKKLDPDTSISFAFELPNENNESVVRGWSTLFKVKDIAPQLEKTDLTDCKGARLYDAPYIEYNDVQELIDAANKAKK